MSLTITRLVAEVDLQLTVRGDVRGLDQVVGWVAVSELPDPTPWMCGAELLLTSGMWLQGLDDRAAAADAWARRLAAAGTRAIGFGQKPWFGETPTEVIAATTRHRLTLIEVPPGTPFVAVTRRVAELQAAEANRIALAAMRGQQRLVTAASGGPAAVVAALAKELGCWVVSLDAAHAVVEQAGLPGPALDRRPTDSILREAVTRAERMQRHSLLIGGDENPVYVVPIGPVHNRQGSLCVDGRAVTAHAGSAAGLAGTTAAILSVLRDRTDPSVVSVVVELLIAGDEQSARSVCRAAQLRLPDTLAAVCLSGPNRRTAQELAIELGMWPAPARWPGFLVVLAASDVVAERLPALVQGTGVRAGVSATHQPGNAANAVREAVRVVSGARDGRRIVHYRSARVADFTTLLSGNQAREFAAALLAPLEGQPDRLALVEAADSWLKAHGRWDPAAAALGVHRDTLRRRVARLLQLLGLEQGSALDQLALAVALESQAQEPARPARDNGSQQQPSSRSARR